ncbi:MAG: cation:proton antiporter [Betaproteobacteria bacterium]|nr:cation:proton antiporter [Betaproteobacteria bacterium]
MNNPTASAAQFFLQLSFILAACAVCRTVMRRIGQPPVIGEMIAGVLLGPSLFGIIAPDLFQIVFSTASRPVLFAVAQLGLSLYMFVVGLEFRTDVFRAHLRTAALVSGAGIIAPFVFAGFIAFWLVQKGGYFMPHVSVAMAVLFIGAAMSITAFPMLARIILENGLKGTAAGTVALAAGSFDDVVAWMLLATVLGCVSGDPMLVVTALVGGLIYTFFCLKLLSPILHYYFKDQKNESAVLGTLMLLLGLCAWFTDLIGLYSVFGSFILGLAVPRGVAEKTAERISPVTTALLLPFFFTYSGLNTRFSLLNSLALWLICLCLVLAAIAAKLGACYAAARFCRKTHSEALTIGSLMNARGLMELILLNIGLQAGLITPTLFTMLVLMAVVTTLMAAPGFNAAKRLLGSSC